MNKAYQAKRIFWHNLKNFDKAKAHPFGDEKILVAGMEFVLCDSNGKPKNIFLAVNSCLCSQMCYEADTKAGIGVISGQHNKIFRNIITDILNESVNLIYNMHCCKHLPAYPKLNFVNFYVLGRKEKFCKTLTYAEIHYPEHPYYPVFIYFRQLISEMRKTVMLADKYN